MDICLYALYLHGKYGFSCLQSEWKALLYGYACSAGGKVLLYRPRFES